MVNHITPMVQALLSQIEPLCQFLSLVRNSVLEPMQDIESNLDIPLCHVVGVGVIVDVLMPFVGADHIIELIILVLCVIFGAASVELGGAQHYFRAVIVHEIVITCNAPVLPDSI